MTVPVEHCLSIVQFWTTYALSRSAIVCQAFSLSLIMELVLPFFSYIFHLFIELHQELLFSGREIWSVTLIHVPISDSMNDRKVCLSMLWTHTYSNYPTTLGLT